MCHCEWKPMCSGRRFLVVQNAQGKTYSNASELDVLVKTIVNNISSLILLEYNSMQKNKGQNIATPDSSCTGFTTLECLQSPEACYIVNGTQCAASDQVKQQDSQFLPALPGI